MMVKEKRRINNRIPARMAWFLIISTLPQILGIENGFIDTVVKLLTIAVFTLLVFRSKDLLDMNIFFLVYICVSVARSLGTLLINQVGIVSLITEILTNVLLFYLFYEKPRNTKIVTKENVNEFFEIFVWFMVVACVYNMIFNFSEFISFSRGSVYTDDGAKSFFDNKNTFGIFLMFGTIASTNMAIETKERKWLAITGLFVLNELAAQCKTAIYLSAVVVLFVILINKKVKMSRKVAAVAVIFIGSRIPVVYNFFSNMLSDTQSMDIRNFAVERMLPLVKGIRFFFGYGNDLARNLAVAYTGNQYYHNTYLYALISGGFFKFLLYIVGIGVSLLFGYRILKLDRETGWLSIITTGSYVVYAWMESFILFHSNVVSLLATVFVVTIPILRYNALAYGSKPGRG